MLLFLLVLILLLLGLDLGSFCWGAWGIFIIVCGGVCSIGFVFFSSARARSMCRRETNAEKWETEPVPGDV